jgi:tetratricopeptide (TPR) repeat protein
VCSYDLDVGYPDLAINRYNQAIEWRPDNPLPYVSRGQATERLGQRGETEAGKTARMDAALGDYNQALALVPNFGPALLYRANLCNVTKRYEQAVADYLALIELDKDNPQSLLYSNLGECYCQWGQHAEAQQAAVAYDEGIKYLSLALRRNDIKNNDVLADIWANRGAAYFGKGNMPKAIEDFDRAIKMHPYDPSLFRNRGTCYMRDGNDERAQEDFKKADAMSAR